MLILIFAMQVWLHWPHPRGQYALYKQYGSEGLQVLDLIALGTATKQ